MNKLVIIVSLLIIFNWAFAQIPGEIDYEDNNKSVSPSSYIMFINASSGLCFVNNFDLAFAGTIGWGSKNIALSSKGIGRLGINYTGTFTNKNSNFTLQYEEPISIRNMYFIPKIGAGFVTNFYTQELFNEEHAFSYKKKIYEQNLGFVLGGAVEVKISKFYFLKIGYDWFYALGWGETSNYAILLTFGYYK
jgi:hypothetical protein